MTIQIHRRKHERKHSREQSITILLNDRPVAISQGTPDNLKELAVGFLISEGRISDRGKLRDIQVDVQELWVNVLSDEESGSGSEEIHRRVSSSGSAQSALLRDTSLCTPIPQSDPLITFRAEDLVKMMNQLLTMSPQRNAGEGVHGCGIGNKGDLIYDREDIGRHNAMDKLVGQAWLDGLSFSHMALFTTGRISYEMALKAVRVNVPVLASHKSVTDAAIEIAEELNLTLVGKCRDRSIHVHTHHERIVL